MEKLKVSEIFYSIQGEGRYMGVPSVFLRTFGCNFKCAGFGMPKGELTDEPDQVAENIHLYNSYEELPLVEKGCDSYATWHPAMKHLSPFMDLDDVANQVVDTLPYKEWRDEHLVITGGEPLLKWQTLYPELLSHARMRSLKEMTFETNGTQALVEAHVHARREDELGREDVGQGGADEREGQRSEVEAAFGGADFLQDSEGQ